MDAKQIGEALDRYGFSTVAFGILTYLLVWAIRTLYRDVILPGAKAHIAHIDKTAAANEEFAKAQTVQAAAMTTQATALTQQTSTLTQISEAVKRVACQHPGK